MKSVYIVQSHELHCMQQQFFFFCIDERQLNHKIIQMSDFEPEISLLYSVCSLQLAASSRLRAVVAMPLYVMRWCIQNVYEHKRFMADAKCSVQLIVLTFAIGSHQQQTHSSSHSISRADFLQTIIVYKWFLMPSTSFLAPISIHFIAKSMRLKEHESQANCVCVSLLLMLSVADWEKATGFSE